MDKVCGNCVYYLNGCTPGHTDDPIRLCVWLEIDLPDILHFTPKETGTAYWEPVVEEKPLPPTIRVGTGTHTVLSVLTRGRVSPLLPGIQLVLSDEPGIVREYRYDPDLAADQIIGHIVRYTLCTGDYTLAEVRLE